MNKKSLQLLLSLSITGVHVYLLLLSMEWIYRGSFSATVFWLKEFTKPFIYNLFFLFLLFCSLHIFKRKLWLVFSAILSLPFLLLAFASHIKQEIRGEPVLPSDLILGSEAVNMFSIFTNTSYVGVIAGFILVAAIIVCLVYMLPNQQGRNYYQISIAILMLGIFLIAYQYESKHESSYFKRKLNIANIPYDQKMTYERGGLVAGFIMNMKWLTMEAPVGYSEDRINKIVEGLESTSSQTGTDKPNIIVIMSEAFWDPTQLKNVQFNKDPIPYFHHLEENGISGKLTVPVFGGSTVNTEFEFLTGISTQFLPVGSIAYLQYVKKPIPSLPFSLKEQGYDTTAIHTWHHWFYNRSTVFKYLGFDRFISLEFMEQPLPDLPYIQDRTLTEEILKKLNDGTNTPKFIFAVSTQNHGPYSSEQKKEFANIEVEEKNEFEGLTKMSENILESFSDNLTQVDKEIEDLVSKVEKTNKKSIVVVFGDHLPLLGNDFKVYRETGFFKENDSYQEYLNMYSTPYIIWDNFTNEKEDYDIGSTMLGALVLDRAGLRGNYFINYLQSKFKNNELARITRSDFLDKEKIHPDVISELQLLQYDLLFGKMYGLNQNQINDNEKYLLGYGEPQITEVKVEMRDGMKYLLLKGRNFTSSSSVFINDEKVDKEKNTGTEIYVPYTGKTKNLKIRIEITDYNNKTLAKSKEFIFMH